MVRPVLIAAALAVVSSARLPPVDEQGRDNSSATAARSIAQIELGAVKLTLPAPAGFEDMFAGSDDIKRRFASTLTQDTLAVHVPADVAATFRPGQALSYYTLVRVLKEARATDVTPAEFKELVTELSKKKLFSMQAAQDYLAAAQRRTGVTVGTPTELGIVSRTPQSVSVMIILPLSAGQQQVTRVAVQTSLYLRRRLIYLNSFRDLGSVDDIKILQDLSSRWVDAVVAANK